MAVAVARRWRDGGGFSDGKGGAEPRARTKGEQMSRSDRGMPRQDVRLPLHCETLCERSRGMPFICVWHKFGAEVRRAKQAC